MEATYGSNFTRMLIYIIMRRETRKSLNLLFIRPERIISEPMLILKMWNHRQPPQCWQVDLKLRESNFRKSWRTNFRRTNWRHLRWLYGWQSAYLLSSPLWVISYRLFTFRIDTIVQLVAVTAECLVESINGLTDTGHISKEFVGVILLPIVCDNRTMG